ncbi:MAG: hypothetical protein RLZZ347_426 [Candidatus Parcubacteria bacterium]|jgi:hypothetical protein
MSERIWNDRCMDCYNKRPITLYSSQFLPVEIRVELCSECIARREEDVRLGKEPALVGLPTFAEWVAGPSLTVRVSGEEVRVALRYVNTGELAGLARLQFAGQSLWLPAGCFSTSPAHVVSEARSFLRMFYFPGAKVDTVSVT